MKSLFKLANIWIEKNRGVSQRLVLGPLLLLIYVNDIPDGTTSMWEIVADDTSPFSKVLHICY